MEQNSIEFLKLQKEFVSGKAEKTRTDILSWTVRELSEQAVFVMDKEFFGTLPDAYVYHEICPGYNGGDFTNYVIVPRIAVELMEVFPEIREILAYRAYEISALPARKQPFEKAPQRLEWLYSKHCRWRKPSQLPQRVLEEIDKLERKLGGWLTFRRKANQVNVIILECYLSLEKMNCGWVYKDELAKVAGEELSKKLGEDVFEKNFVQMDRIAPENHAKVFQVEKEEDGRQRVCLWCFAERVIRKIENPGYVEFDEIEDILSKL